MSKRTKAQRRWHRKGYTHEVGWWSEKGQVRTFILVLRPHSVSYFRKNLLEDEFVRPICPVMIHKGGKP